MAGYSLLVTAHPASGRHEAAISAITDIVERGDQVRCLFFYRDGVRISDHSPASDRLRSMWLSQLRQYRIEAVVCSGALSRLGLDDADLPQCCPDGGFIAGGLGQWADAVRHSDHILQFGEESPVSDRTKSPCI